MNALSRYLLKKPFSEPVYTKRAEIDLGVLGKNFQACLEKIKSTSPTARVLAVVKADAYGHGTEPCVRALLEVGCDFFAVSCIEEALAVRSVCRNEKKDADILILGYTTPRYARELVENNLMQTLLSPSYAKELAEAATNEKLSPISVHVAIDTGMGRIGYAARTEKETEQTVRDILTLREEKAFAVCGMFTHFARADEELASAKEMTTKQATRYRTLKERLEADGMTIPFHHACNSAAALTRPNDIFDGVRLGLSLYTPPTYTPKRLNLQPVMQLSADIIHIQTIPAGESVGYGSRFTALNDTVIGVLPIGYADGIPRSLKGATLSLQTRDGRFPVKIIGSVCMDQCMIDLSGICAYVGDRVTFFGHTNTSLNDLSTHAGTIPYELLCAISPRVPRTYHE